MTRDGQTARDYGYKPPKPDAVMSTQGILNAPRFIAELNYYQAAVHRCAVDHGWWESERNFGEMIALMHSELSEALEAWRDGDIPTEIRYEYPGAEGGTTVLYQPDFLYADDAGAHKELGKPVGVASEFADVIIRIFDTCEKLKIPLAEALVRKHQYNLTRPYRHGGKKA